MSSATVRVVLEKAEWRARANQQLARASEWTNPYRERRANGKLHPIYDFLFIYYRLKPSQLDGWHPGIGVGLIGACNTSAFSERYYGSIDKIVSINPQKMDTSTRHRLEMVLRLSKIVAGRTARFGCFGMHEWAMVYRGDCEGEIRHRESLPLRLPQDQIDTYVRSQPIACSHYDAFRFFSEPAQTFNRLQPNKDTRIENEQSGCLHTNMDLYKLCGQCMPWIGSDLLWKSFELAIRARQLDMQASPYDCQSLGFAPVKIETEAGREEYEQRQRELREQARPIREELIVRLEAILA